MKRGFTLVEMMVTTVILTIVLAALGSAFLGLTRLMRVAYAQSELAINADLLRDRLLNCLVPADGTFWPGLRTLPIQSVDTVAINLLGWRFIDESFHVERIATRLMWQEDNSGDGGKICLDNVDASSAWLNPAGLGLVGDWEGFKKTKGEPDKDQFTDKNEVHISIRMATNFNGAAPRVEQVTEINIPSFDETGIGDD